MTDPIIACVSAGSLDDVRRLRDAVMGRFHRPHTMVCLTDQPERIEGVVTIETSGSGLPASWAKLLLFDTLWRGQSKIIYFDPAVVVAGDITPLADVPGEFAIWKDASDAISVMVIGGGMAGFVWTRFCARQDELMRLYTEDACIDRLYPRAPQLKQMLPKGFFGQTTASGVGLT